MLEAIVGRAAAEVVTLEPQPAEFTHGDARIAGEAEALISRASIAIRFRRRDAFTIAKAAYGEFSGSVTATREGGFTAEVNDAGKAANGDQLFVSRALRCGAPAAADAVAATRLVLAGDAWAGSGTIRGRRFVAAPLASDVVSHHDRRLAIAVEGELDEELIETIGRAGAFVAGIDLEILRVERFGADGLLRDVEHRRGFRRVGRGAHSPFTGVPAADRARAWAALVDAFPDLIAGGMPIDMIVDQLSAHNQVAQIHVSAVLLLLAVQTAAYARLHGATIAAQPTTGRAELERLSRDLGLGLDAADLTRYENVRRELFDGGFFHAPGYETGRPQKDIKFLRDLAHVTVLRLSGYTGPFYGAERFVVRELAGAPS